MDGELGIWSEILEMVRWVPWAVKEVVPEVDGERFEARGMPEVVDDVQRC